MVVDYLGIVLVSSFYISILCVAAWVTKKKSVLGTETKEELLVAGRTISPFITVLTLAATEVGGGFLNGSAEEVYRRGLLWCQAPVGYAISFFINGIFFVEDIRYKGYLSITDPLQETYGPHVGALLFLAPIIGDVCWTASVLSALGSTLSVVLGLSQVVGVISGAVVAIIYTLIGGLYSVVYTDIIQLLMIFSGLYLCLPFICFNPAVNFENTNYLDWIGHVPMNRYLQFADNYLLLICGGIPWQAFYQRILACKSPEKVKCVSIASCALIFVFLMPPVLIGVAARVTDWNQTLIVDPFYPINNPDSILPLSIQYLTPYFIGLLGLAAIAAAVMSSVDSGIFASSVIIANNMYKVIRKEASNKEIIWITRTSVIFLGACATVIALNVSSIYGIWFLASDLGYVILFPMFFCAIKLPKYVNGMGAAISASLTFMLRLSCGEVLLGVPALLELPGFVNGEQTFPFRTLLMILCFIMLLLISWVFNVFKRVSYDLSNEEIVYLRSNLKY